MSIYTALKIYDPEKKFHLMLDRNGYLESCVYGKSVLHVGCSDWPITPDRLTDGTLLHLQLQRASRELVGIDLSEMGIAALRTHGVSNVQVMDAETINLAKKFDVILAGDVLEHMNNPGRFLHRAVSLLGRDGEVIVGVPSALTINNIKTWLGGGEQVHSDHTFYFSPKTLSALHERFGLLPVKLIFTVQPPGMYESKVFLNMRKALLKMNKAMAPSIIMHFKKTEEVEKSQYIEWT